MGAHYPQPYGPCDYVLVLLPERTRDPDLVERMDYAIADRAVCAGSWYEMKLI